MDCKNLIQQILIQLKIQLDDLYNFLKFLRHRVDFSSLQLNKENLLRILSQLYKENYLKNNCELFYLSKLFVWLKIFTINRWNFKRNSMKILIDQHQRDLSTSLIELFSRNSSNWNINWYNIRIIHIYYWFLDINKQGFFSTDILCWQIQFDHWKRNQDIF